MLITLPQYFKSHNYFTAATGKIYDPRCVEGRVKDDPQSWSTPYKTLNYKDIKYKSDKRFARVANTQDENLADGQILLNGITLLR